MDRFRPRHGRVQQRPPASRTRPSARRMPSAEDLAALFPPTVASDVVLVPRSPEERRMAREAEVGGWERSPRVGGRRKRVVKEGNGGRRGVMMGGEGTDVGEGEKREGEEGQTLRDRLAEHQRTMKRALARMSGESTLGVKMRAFYEWKRRVHALHDARRAAGVFARSSQRLSVAKVFASWRHHCHIAQLTRLAHEKEEEARRKQEALVKDRKAIEDATEGLVQTAEGQISRWMERHDSSRTMARRTLSRIAKAELRVAFLQFREHVRHRKQLRRILLRAIRYPLRAAFHKWVVYLAGWRGREAQLTVQSISSELEFERHQRMRVLRDLALASSLPPTTPIHSPQTPKTRSKPRVMVTGGGEEEGIEVESGVSTLQSPTTPIPGEEELDLIEEEEEEEEEEEVEEVEEVEEEEGERREVEGEEYDSVMEDEEEVEVSHVEVLMARAETEAANTRNALLRLRASRARLAMTAIEREAQVIMRGTWDAWRRDVASRKAKKRAAALLIRRNTQLQMRLALGHWRGKAGRATAQELRDVLIATRLNRRKLEQELEKERHARDALEARAKTLQEGMEEAEEKLRTEHRRAAALEAKVRAMEKKGEQRAAAVTRFASLSGGRVHDRSVLFSALGKWKKMARERISARRTMNRLLGLGRMSLLRFGFSRLRTATERLALRDIQERGEKAEEEVVKLREELEHALEHSKSLRDALEAEQSARAEEKAKMFAQLEAKDVEMESMSEELKTTGERLQRVYQCSRHVVGGMGKRYRMLQRQNGMLQLQSLLERRRRSGRVLDVWVGVKEKEVMRKVFVGWKMERMERVGERRSRFAEVAAASAEDSLQHATDTANLALVELRAKVKDMEEERERLGEAKGVLEERLLVVEERVKEELEARRKGEMALEEETAARVAAEEAKTEALEAKDAAEEAVQAMYSRMASTSRRIAQRWALSHGSASVRYTFYQWKTRSIQLHEARRTAAQMAKVHLRNHLRTSFQTWHAQARVERVERLAKLDAEVALAAALEEAAVEAEAKRVAALEEAEAEAASLRKQMEEAERSARESAHASAEASKQEALSQSVAIRFLGSSLSHSRSREIVFATWKTLVSRKKTARLSAERLFQVKSRSLLRESLRTWRFGATLSAMERHNEEIIQQLADEALQASSPIPPSSPKESPVPIDEADVKEEGEGEEVGVEEGQGEPPVSPPSPLSPSVSTSETSPPPSSQYTKKLEDGVVRLMRSRKHAQALRLWLSLSKHHARASVGIQASLPPAPRPGCLSFLQ